MAPVNMDRPVQVILDWAEASGSMEAGGEVAWNDHGRAGVRFSSIGETSRDRLVEWLFQDVAARCTRRENPNAVRGPHGLTLPAPGLGRTADTPSSNGKSYAAAGQDGLDQDFDFVIQAGGMRRNSTAVRLRMVRYRGGIIRAKPARRRLLRLFGNTSNRTMSSVPSTRDDLPSVPATSGRRTRAWAVLREGRGVSQQGQSGPQ
jgi:hypothetical protein